MPVNIRGKVYLTVAERLVSGHGSTGRPVGIQSISSVVEQVGAWAYVRSTILFADGRMFSGLAEISRGQGAGPQASSPVEVAETSAVGRALAMAGWHGSDDGLAGYEEVALAHARGTRPVTMGTTDPRTVSAVVRRVGQ